MATLITSGHQTGKLTACRRMDGVRFALFLLALFFYFYFFFFLIFPSSNDDMRIEGRY